MTLGRSDERAVVAGHDRLETLYVRWSGDGIRLAYLLTGNRGDAEDLFHDSFIRAASRFLRMRDPSSFGPYLRKTIVNAHISKGRRSVIGSRALRLISRDVEAAPTTRFEDRVDQRDRLRRALASLPVRQRTAVVLRHFTGLSIQETAQTMKCSEGSVRSLTSRGIAALREEIRT